MSKNYVDLREDVNYLELSFRCPQTIFRLSFLMCLKFIKYAEEIRHCDVQWFVQGHTAVKIRTQTWSYELTSSFLSLTSDITIKDRRYNHTSDGNMRP